MMPLMRTDQNNRGGREAQAASYKRLIVSIKDEISYLVIDINYRKKGRLCLAVIRSTSRQTFKMTKTIVKSQKNH